MRISKPNVQDILYISYWNIINRDKHDSTVITPQKTLIISPPRVGDATRNRALWVLNSQRVLPPHVSCKTRLKHTTTTLYVWEWGDKHSLEPRWWTEHASFRWRHVRKHHAPLWDHCFDIKTFSSFVCSMLKKRKPFCSMPENCFVPRSLSASYASLPENDVDIKILKASDAACQRTVLIPMHLCQKVSSPRKTPPSSLFN